jgi:hypothetical protein
MLFQVVPQLTQFILAEARPQRSSHCCAAQRVEHTSLIAMDERPSPRSGSGRIDPDLPLR